MWVSGSVVLPKKVLISNSTVFQESMVCYDIENIDLQQDKKLLIGRYSPGWEPAPQEQMVPGQLLQISKLGAPLEQSKREKYEYEYK